ncbi:MAG TPA: transcription-repair coupling factor, partial [Cytophagaceae bacterium]
MKPKELLRIYEEDGLIRTISEKLQHSPTKNFQFKGLTGSLDAVLAGAIVNLYNKTHIFVLHDKEEAAYFLNDLQNLLSGKEILFFPTSYKRPYKFEEIENANVLSRAETLNRVSNKKENHLIVTYPEALNEKVINKRSLLENTFSGKIGEKVDIAFLTELLSNYDFEKTDFVYEAGQFAVRGGIVDIFSFSNDYPYRIEFFGDEIESIRTFNPDTQLSVETKQEFSIIPDVQTKLLQETRESFFSFIPSDSVLWFKDIDYTA